MAGSSVEHLHHLFLALIFILDILEMVDVISMNIDSSNNNNI
jgi:hypothetical protein